MAGNKKPTRKKRRERNEFVPMMGPTRDALAISLHTSVETLINTPSRSTFNHVSKKIAVMAVAVEFMSRTLPREKMQAKIDAVNLAAKTLKAISERHERVGKIGVSEDEANTLKQCAGSLDEALGTTPTNVFKAAAQDVARFDAISI